jgi:hypothetical protein
LYARDVKIITLDATISDDCPFIKWPKNKNVTYKKIPKGINDALLKVYGKTPNNPGQIKL